MAAVFYHIQMPYENNRKLILHTIPKKWDNDTVENIVDKRWELLQLLPGEKFDYKYGGGGAHKSYDRIYILDGGLVNPDDKTLDDKVHEIGRWAENGGSIIIIKSGDVNIGIPQAEWENIGGSVHAKTYIRQHRNTGFGALNRNRASRYSFGLL